MGIQIKTAKNPYEIDKLCQLRHTVLVDEEKVFTERQDKRIYDRFDILPTSTNLIALNNNEIIGTVRLTLDSKAGLPSDEIFDYSPYLQNKHDKVVCCSMVCIRDEFKNNFKILLGLLMMSYYWCTYKEYDYIAAMVNTEISNTFELVGFKTIGEEIFYGDNETILIPMILDLKRVNDLFLAYAKKQKMIHYLENFKRELYSKGEKIIEAGDIGNSAYIIVDGKVAVTRSDSNSTEKENILNELGAGEIFGEIALLTEAKRTANVIALSDVDLMILEREDFQSQIIQNPENFLEILHSLGNRLKDTLELLSSNS